MKKIEETFKKKNLIYVDMYVNKLDIIKKIPKPFKIKRLFTENQILLKNNKNFPFKIFLTNKYSELKKYNKNRPLIAISCGFGLIFKKKIISEYKNGIWNIHYGDLPKFRGRHPITAAFLKNEKKIGVSMHSIDDKIDRGILLAKTFVTRNLKNDENSIKKKILKKIPNLIKQSLKNFIDKNTKKIPKGVYYKAFFNGIKLTNSKRLDKIYIYNAIKAQKSYGGVTINNEKFIDVKFYNKKCLFKKNYKILYCKDSEKLIVKKSNN
jgi:methionyl-tRNA formyltransferase